MSDRTWKASERQHAKQLGLERIPVTGRQRDIGGADYEDGLICYSHKHAYNQPGYILGWLRAICAYAARQDPSKLGAIVWHKKGGRRDDSLVVMRFSDWVQLHGSIGSPEETE